MVLSVEDDDRESRRRRSLKCVFEHSEYTGEMVDFISSKSKHPLCICAHLMLGLSKGSDISPRKCYIYWLGSRQGEENISAVVYVGVIVAKLG